MTRKMKDSGIEWIGEIPEEWKVAKFKNVASLYVGDSIKDSEKDNYLDTNNAREYIATKDITANINTIDFSNTLYVQKNDLNFKLALNGSSLMCIEGGGAGRKKAFLDRDVCFVNKLCCINPFDFMNKKYVFYLISNGSFEQEFDKYLQGLIGGVSVSKLSNFNIPIPKLEEQDKIALLLDKEVGGINYSIGLITGQIRTLEDYRKSVITEAVTKGLDKNVEMKDSGVEWIGEIPKHWEVKRGKYILKLLKRPVNGDDEVITCFRDGRVTLRSNIREDGFTFADKEIGYQGINKGDLVVHGMDGFAGAIGISDSRGKGSPVLNVLDSPEDKWYLALYLRVMAYSDVFTALATGIRVRSVDLRWNKLSELPYPVPPVEEQEEILRYIAKKFLNINRLIGKKEKQLYTLEEYKKSLIYEYVTGKKEVE